MAKAPFSFSELLVLLDVQEVPATSSPFPTMAELAPLVGPLRFQMSAPHFCPPEGATLSATPIDVSLSIPKMPGLQRPEMWAHLHGYIVGYLEDTLTKVAKGQAAPGYRTYRGHGVLVLFVYTTPTGYGGHGEPRLDVAVLRDEHPLMTIARLFGVAPETLAFPLDTNWRTLSSTLDMHVEASIAAHVLRLRCIARRTEPEWSAALKCTSWATSWLKYWLPMTGAFRVNEVADRKLGEHEHATRWAIGKDPVITIGSRTARRDSFEIHVPLSWRSDAGVASLGETSTPHVATS